jgi:hypothetical protein
MPGCRTCNTTEFDLWLRIGPVFGPMAVRASNIAEEVRGSLVIYNGMNTYAKNSSNMYNSNTGQYRSYLGVGVLKG